MAKTKRPDPVAFIKERDSKEFLLRVLEDAAAKEQRVRVLRLGTPGGFRRDVIEQLKGLYPADERACGLLLDKDIPGIEFLLADPFGEPYLHRMDVEHRDNWDLLRVQAQILEFARALMDIRERRPRGRCLTLAFHLSELVWNLTIIGEGPVLLRVYTEQGANDTFVETIDLWPGSACRLAESFVTYYESVRAHTETFWVSSRGRLNEFVRDTRLPSLFKGNAVHVPTDDERRLPEYRGVEDCFFKVCSDPRAFEAEREWLSLKDERRRRCRFFRPPSLKDLVDIPDRGAALPMERIDGPTLFEVVAEIQRRGEGEDEATKEHLGRVLGLILSQAISALKEFREHATSVQERLGASHYPYRDRLVEAISSTSVSLGVVLQREVNEAVDAADSLGRELERHATVSFRDAHLKNRLLKVRGQSAEQVVAELATMTIPQAEAFLLRYSYDIDFETAAHLVTPWDDVAHALFFEKTGLSPIRFKDVDVTQAIREWVGEEVESEDILWKTIFARATREACRRFWYARVMPNAHNERYLLESRDFFLDLARYATTRINGYVPLNVFLRRWSERADEFWDRVPPRRTPESIRAIRPAKAKPVGDALSLELDTRTKVARFLGQRLECPPAAFQTLALLCQTPGELVPRASITTALDCTDRTLDKNASLVRGAFTKLISRGRVKKEDLVARVQVDGDEELARSALVALTTRDLVQAFVITEKKRGLKIAISPAEVRIVDRRGGDRRTIP